VGGNLSIIVIDLVLKHYLSEEPDLIKEFLKL
jgi:hypothetical protein